MFELHIWGTDNRYCWQARNEDTGLEIMPADGREFESYEAAHRDAEEAFKSLGCARIVDWVRHEEEVPA